MDAKSIARTIEEILAPRVVTTTISFLEHETDGPTWKVVFQVKLKDGQEVGWYILLSEQLLAREWDATYTFMGAIQNFKDALDRLESVAGHSIEEMRAMLASGELPDPDHFADRNICPDPARHDVSIVKAG